MAQQIEVRTRSHDELVDITDQVQGVVSRHGVTTGLCHVFVPHTTAGLTLNENWDPSVRRDVLVALDKLVPWDDDYQHGEGNSAAHVKASLMGFSHTLLVENGRLVLGSWQGIYLTEFDGPRRRRVWVSVQPSD
jgi:secondary thiamine-phosphate synthase enzyme